jgi:hypothetical protein
MFNSDSLVVLNLKVSGIGSSTLPGKTEKRESQEPNHE